MKVPTTMVEAHLIIHGHFWFKQVLAKKLFMHITIGKTMFCGVSQLRFLIHTRNENDNTIDYLCVISIKYIYCIRNFFHFPMVLCKKNYVLWLKPSWISDRHKKKPTFCKGPTTDHSSYVCCQKWYSDSRKE